MSIRRITISVPEATARQLKRAAGETPMSTWLTDLIEEKLQNTELERRWDEFYRAVAPNREASRRAAAMFKRLVKPRRRGAA